MTGIVVLSFGKFALWGVIDKQMLHQGAWDAVFYTPQGPEITVSGSCLLSINCYTPPQGSGLFKGQIFAELFIWLDGTEIINHVRWLFSFKTTVSGKNGQLF